MKIPTLLVAIVWAFANQTIGLCSGPRACTDPRPNIVLIFIDDLGYHDIGCYGSTFYETPRLDALAKQSVRFTDFYSAHPVCSPTRAALMTGKAPQRVGIVDWIPQPSEIHLPHRENTIAESLAAAGYDTGYIGKWHLGEKDDQLPTSHGFSWQRCVNRGGQPGSYYFPFERVNRRKKNSSPTANFWDVPDLKGSDPNSYLTDRLTDQAIEYIGQKRDNPFFLCLSHYAVHTPIQPPKNRVEKYNAKAKLLPPDPEPVSEKHNSVSRSRQDNPNYAAMIENLDTNVGRLLDALQQGGQSQNTIVIFTSDNGGLTTKPKRVGPTSVVPLRAGKGWCYEGGIRVPCLIRWPAKLKPTVCQTPSITMDLYPTLLDACGADPIPDQHLDGISLMETVQGKPVEERLLGWHYPKRHGSGHRPSTAIRVGQHKAIHFIESDKWELYDLANDRQEKHNLASTQPEMMDALKARLNQWREQTTTSSAK